MNIHFKDKDLFENLKNATLAKVRVGSHLYGTNNENSDEDFLYIYATSEAELRSFIWTNHQLQYKEEGIDHNFVSLHSFIRNIINGDSTINFEVVNSTELENTCLDFLHDIKSIFNTYTIARSYNGFARRDCKHWSKAKTDQEKLKRFGHIVRGYCYADLLIENCFDFNKANNSFKDILDVMHIKNNVAVTLDDIKHYSMLLDDQRKELNKRFENKTLNLAKMMDVSSGKKLEFTLKLLQFSDEFKIKQEFLKNFDMSIFINAFENWVEYE